MVTNRASNLLFNLICPPTNIDSDWDETRCRHFCWLNQNKFCVNISYVNNYFLDLDSEQFIVSSLMLKTSRWSKRLVLTTASIHKVHKLMSQFTPKIFQSCLNHNCQVPLGNFYETHKLAVFFFFCLIFLYT